MADTISEIERDCCLMLVEIFSVLPKTEFTEELIPTKESNTFDPKRELSSACFTPSDSILHAQEISLLPSGK
jgi:hypothetical protein